MKINIEVMCALSAVMDKMEISRDQIIPLFEEGSKANSKSKNEKEVLQKQLGAELLLLLGRKIHLAKKEIIELIALYKEISEEEAKKIDIVEFFKELMGDDTVKNFFK